MSNLIFDYFKKKKLEKPQASNNEFYVTDTKKVTEPLKFGNDKTLLQNDKLSHLGDTREKLRYIKIIFPDGSVSYTELSPGVEKPRDKSGIRFEYCSRLAMVKHYFILQYGFKQWVHFINTYRDKKRAEKMAELELIRHTAKDIAEKLTKNYK